MRFQRFLPVLLIFCSGLAWSADESVEIRAFLEGLDAGDAPMVAGRTLHEPELLSAIYRQRQHVPVWTEGGPLQSGISDMLAEIGVSVSHGFAAEHYHRSAIERLRQAQDPGSINALELLLTDAFLSQSIHRARGAVFPPNLDADWQMPAPEIDSAAMLQSVIDEPEMLVSTLEKLWPIDPEYGRLLKRRAEIVASEAVDTVQIAGGALLRPGQSNDRVILLKQRLLGPGDHDAFFDDDLRAEVIAFQASVGLEPDGLVGNSTLEFMNATKVSWIDRIDANLERWRWLPRETPDTYVRVNIAAFTLRAIEDGEVAMTMNVIVGQPYRQTPIFTETIKYLVLNPYWNVPFSIATKDKLALLKSNASEQAEKGFETKAHGSDTFVSVDAIDWSEVTRRGFNYLLRQRPGPSNALGRIKFMLPNPNAVYLHDTPSRELFSRQERSFSSGCIRVEKPLELAAWLLGLEQHPQSTRVEELLSTPTTQTIYLKQPVPTYLVYFTAFSLEDGTVTFRRDIYGRDAVLIDALRAQQTS